MDSLPYFHFRTDISGRVRWVFSVIRRQLFNAETWRPAEFKKRVDGSERDPERMPAQHSDGKAV